MQRRIMQPKKNNQFIQQNLNATLHNLMRDLSNVVLIGEDICDPYGGAFKVTKGLSLKYPDRIINSPISEAGITGIGIGLALKGFKPIIEIMFGDFTTLIFDQIVNQASKISTMYNNHIPIPLIIRTPMGGGRGYGPTHSQSLERFFCGIPGIMVVAISPLYEPGKILTHLVSTSECPTLFIEHKLLYTQQIYTEAELYSRYGLTLKNAQAGIPIVSLSHDEQPDITFITYGGMTQPVLDAIDELHRYEELSCEVIVVHQLSPLDLSPVIKDIQKSRRLVIVEEGITAWGWGSEVISLLSEIELEAPPQRVGAHSLPIPACRHLEDQVLPGTQNIISAALNTIDQMHT